MVKPKSKSKSNDKNGEKSSKSRRFSLMRSLRSLSARKKAAQKKEKAATEKKGGEEAMASSVYFDLKKADSRKSKKRQSRMGSVDPSVMGSSDDKTAIPSSQMSKIPEYENIKTAKVILTDDTPSNRSKKKNEKNYIFLEKRKKKQQKNLGSVFEDVAGPLSPVNAEPKGIEDKMRWKIDVEGVDLNGDQKMSEVMEKLGQLRKKYKTQKCKVLKANEKTPRDSDEEPTEEDIVMAAKILQFVRMDQIIHEKLDSDEKEILRKYCRSGDQEDKAEDIIENITLVILVAVSSKNSFIRQVSIPAQMKMYAVDENKSKLPVMALLMARCDLLYYAWLKPSNNEDELDPTWQNMTIRKVPTPAVVSTYYPMARGKGNHPKK